MRVLQARVALATSSVYPESAAAAFELAARLGYDGIELTVGADELSQDIAAIEHLRDYHQVPVVSIHAPCFLVTPRVWGTDPWGKLDKSLAAAERLGAGTVVLHPPYRWQRDYARDFVTGIRRREEESRIQVAVENMYPWRTGFRGVQAYHPGWDPRESDYAHVTLDLSHTATAGVDALKLARDLGDRVCHLHLTDGSGSIRDEHLVPGRGNQPCAAVLEYLAGADYTGAIVVEISTRGAATRSGREADLVASLGFARRHFGVSGGYSSGDPARSSRTPGECPPGQRSASPVRSSYAVTGDGTISLVER